ncbi:MAG: 16S rRNA (cytidine(1402)-2'-O)-methyltransferase [Alphaproteobacteria bacterium]|nr:16S rRNA (cytidine(1402)-2'-O)-methyltransferase [Alphaproteobacteria bacterium]MCL2757755.1 16S rRNA (cytidine(1402)-2'-O)-methyltransferase [Alphaproteobacteria bacterium]
MTAGLYIVGTPIGNLSDMSPRAIETLRRADLIACEDTRTTGKLAAHFDIKTRRIAFHEHNERDMADELVAKILDGAAVALVSDSGMPGISDPGFRLIRAARAAAAPVFVVPGPTAFAAALVLSGFPTDRFTFCGFFKDEKHLREDNKIRHTIIYYESPNRARETIAIMARIMPERRVAIIREITKIHEETIIGYPAELAGGAPLKGEIVLVIEPAPEQKMSDSEINEIVREVVAAGHKTKDAAAEIAQRTGINKRDAYEKVIRHD